MKMRIDNLPPLSDTYEVRPADVAAYARDGHVLLRSVCSTDEVAAYREALVDAAARYNTEMRPISERDTYGKAFLQIMNLWENDASSRRFVLAKRFAGIAAKLMGVDGVRLYHDQALFKEAHGGPTPWHQDQYYWPLATDKTITMWMPLQDASEEMGTMTFASGSHADGYLGKLEISDKSEEYFQDYIAKRGFHLTKTGAMMAGDATFHSGWTLHGAPGNAAEITREAMTVIYYADGTCVGPADNKNRMDDLERWLPGCEPGGPAAGRLNPLVYP